ncbi:hypothetical protein FVW20_00620 [Desulfovibrio oxamicus]|uniref:Uncharacterized protein n=1 Tax=Nitratidesulfovibrio oxamicus TaxID=32016 RepID=A0ABS0J0M2_9BACT|nr:hypothetical protein [Nitratidesulfovibrio oxamicus]MBG3875566.1 hypothetical protein [Nitratidesulfovibrio oxamicus]
MNRNRRRRVEKCIACCERLRLRVMRLRNEEAAEPKTRQQKDTEADRLGCTGTPQENLDEADSSLWLVTEKLREAIE